MSVKLHQGDCRIVMANLADNSVDSIVTDPPYELAFMGRKWDASGIAYDVKMWEHCLRVLKPGGHMLSFGGTRTHHRMIAAIEDAGFDIRDCLMWLYGTGFPKSLNIGDGWGTALKPAWEPIVLARKPLSISVAENKSLYGTGALNINACRVGSSNRPLRTIEQVENGSMFGLGSGMATGQTDEGRWPANVLLDEVSAAMLDEQSGDTEAGDPREDRGTGGIWHEGNGVPCGPQYGDIGGASRFFYVAKASRGEREAGCDALPVRTAGEATGGRAEGSAGLNSPRAGASRTTNGVRNFHPTVKPILLMRYLCLLVTPPAGLVLDPFMGSGSTGCGAVQEGFSFIGCDLEADHVAIAKARITYWQSHKHTMTTPLAKALDKRSEAALF